MAINTSTAIAIEERARELNRQFTGLSAQQILGRLLRGRAAGRVAVVSSFGAEAACLLRLVADKDPATPVVFLDTRKHFPETLSYIDGLMDQLGMTTLIRARPAPNRLALEDPCETLYASDSDRCCYLRKTLPMIGVLKNFDCVLTGRKRFQTSLRAEMEVVEVQESWLRVNPLADWSRERVIEFLKSQRLLEHPLVSQGYASIGCEPCTAVSADHRAGRWAGTNKSECGIHITKDGRIVRADKDKRG